MNKITYKTKTVATIVTIMATLLFSAKTVAAAFIVPQLPSDNLINNPWFRNSLNKPSLEGWTDATGPLGSWGATDKDGNPTPNNVIGTAARVSAGMGGSNSNLPPHYDAYLYQVVAADPTQTTLNFDTYWVAHTIKPAEVTIYGSNTPNGSWTPVWKPFNQNITTTLFSPPGENHNYWLWNYYSNTTDKVSTTIAMGYPYYKVEIHVNFPDADGGFKITGVYFSTSHTNGNPNPTPNPEPVPTPTPEPTPSPEPTPNPEPSPEPNPRHRSRRNNSISISKIRDNLGI
ncbi:MAG: hypothetical protein ACOZAO_05005 [Patescibacteria group bacterium]